MKAIQTSLEKLKVVLVYAYIWQIPFSWRYIFDPNRGYAGGQFNEYLDISFYLGEILLLIALVIHILEYIIEKKSIFKNWKAELHTLFHMEQSMWLFFPIFLLLNTILSIDLPLSIAALWRIGILLFFVYLFQKTSVPHGTKFIRDIFYILFISIIIQLIIAFFQVVNGSSIGIKFLNESILSLSMDNVAKSNIFSETYLRGYGTFPHPNVLAGYSILFLIYIFSFYKKTFHVERIYIILSVLSVFSIVLITQSKLAILFFLGSIVYQSQKILKIKLFHMERLIVIMSLLIFLGMMYAVFQTDIRHSYETRIEQFNLQWRNQDVSFFGSGIGTYRKSYISQESNWWNLEPVHFAPFIVLREVGMIGMSFLILLLVKYFKNVPRGTLKKNIFPLVAVVFMVCTDHYVWDIYQGMFILWFLFALIYSIDKYYNILYKNNKA